MHFERLVRESGGGGCEADTVALISRMNAQTCGSYWGGIGRWTAGPVGGRRLIVVADDGHPGTWGGVVVQGRVVGNMWCCSLVEVLFSVERGHVRVVMVVEADWACGGRHPG